MGDAHGNEEKKKKKCETKITPEEKQELFKQYVLPHYNDILSLVKYYTDKAQNIDNDFSYVVSQMYKYIHTYSPSRSIRTWIHIVTKRSVFSQIRYRSRIASMYSNEVSVKQVDDEDFMGSSACPEVGRGESYDMIFGSFLDNISDEVYNALMKISYVRLSPFLLQIKGYSIKDITIMEYESGHIDKPSQEIIKSRIFWTKRELQKILTENGIRRKGAKNHKNDGGTHKEGDK